MADNISVELLREAFSEGTVLVHKEGFFVVYTGHKELAGFSPAVQRENLKGVDLAALERIEHDRIAWNTQTFENDLLSTLLSICRESACLWFDSSNPGVVKVGFLLHLADNTAAILPHVVKQRFDDTELINEVFADLANSRREIDDAVAERYLQNLVSAGKEEMRTDVVDMVRVSQWPRIRQLVSVLQNDFACESEVYDQDPEYNDYGYLALHLHERKNTVFDGKTKQALVDLLGLVSAFQIECNVLDGFVNLVFYG